MHVSSAPRAASSASEDSPSPASRETSGGIASVRARRSWTERRIAAAGLLSSCASPAESLPSDAIFSRCCSVREDSRTRSVIVATRRVATSGIRRTISAKCAFGTEPMRVGSTATPSPE